MKEVGVLQPIDLAKRAIAGDEQALVALLQQHEASLYRIAYSYLRSKHDALEAIQEHTYRCYRGIRKVNEPAYIETWLVRVLINICLDMKRKGQREIPSDDIEGNIPVSTDDANEMSLEVMEAIEQLSLAQQELIYLKYFQDRKNADIAHTLQVPEGTIKSRLHTALNKLKLWFREEEIK